MKWAASLKVVATPPVALFEQEATEETEKHEPAFTLFPPLPPVHNLVIQVHRHWHHRGVLVIAYINRRLRTGIAGLGDGEATDVAVIHVISVRPEEHRLDVCR